MARGDVRMSGGGGGLSQVDFNKYMGYNSDITKTVFDTGRTDVSLSEAATASGAAVGDYIVFAGLGTATVNAFDKSLTRLTPSSLGAAKSQCLALSTATHAIFCPYMSNQVYCYDTSLVYTAATAVSSAQEYKMGASNGVHAVIAGGMNSSETMQSLCYYYGADLVRGAGQALSTARGFGRGFRTGAYAVIAGGMTVLSTNTPSGVVNGYNQSMTMSTASALTTAVVDPDAIQVGQGNPPNYGIVGGGFNSSGSSVSTVYVYNASLIKTSGTALSNASAGSNLCFHLPHYGVIIDDSRIPNLYDTSLTKSTMSAFATGFGSYFASGSFDKYAMIPYSTGVFKILTEWYATAKIPVTVGSIYNTGSGEQTAAATSITVNNPFTGYIKYKKGTIS